MTEVIRGEARGQCPTRILRVVRFLRGHLPYREDRIEILIPDAVIHDATRSQRQERGVGVHPAQADDWGIRPEVNACVNLERELNPIDRAAARVYVD